MVYSSSAGSLAVPVHKPLFAVELAPYNRSAECTRILDTKLAFLDSHNCWSPACILVPVCSLVQACIRP